ncbi:MAG: dihydroxyacetone kinase subunit DhaL [Actinomycetota bacterium]|nr:dihydroxyacetone kinase subunit DhaL [Actinomycetota bacterium]
MAGAITENRQYLTKLDSAIGDADHGINLDRGFRAALEKLEASEPSDIGALLKTLGMALVSKVGGAGGPLYGTLFMQMGSAAAGKQSLGPEEWAAALEAGVQGVIARGKAEPGDKTMVDALLPAIEALKEALAEGEPFAEALRRAEGAAEEGMKATIPMVARKGRASYLGERSAGHQDPGATSSHLLVKTAARQWADSS